MDLNEKVEYTEEGFKKFADSLTFIEEDKREAMAKAIVMTIVIE